MQKLMFKATLTNFQTGEETNRTYVEPHKDSESDTADYEFAARLLGNLLVDSLYARWWVPRAIAQMILHIQEHYIDVDLPDGLLDAADAILEPDDQDEPPEPDDKASRAKQFAKDFYAARE